MRRAGTTLLAVLLVNATLSAQAPQPPGGVVPPAGQVPQNTPPLPGQDTRQGGAVVPAPGSGVPAAGLPVSGQGGQIGAPGVAPAAVAPLPPDPVLFQHLQNWEQVMKGANNFYAECGLVRENKLRKTRTDHKGSIMCLKPGMARMRIEAIPAPGAKPDPNDYLAYICTPTAVYEYDGNATRLTEVRFQASNTTRNLLLDFMSGVITAKSALERFNMKIIKQDQFYVYIEVKPRTAQDMADFETMILVLFLKNGDQPAYLPRQVVIRKSNGQEEETWDFPKPGVNVVGVKPEYFTPVPPAKGWNHVVQNAPPANGGAVQPAAGAGQPAAPVPGTNPGNGLPPRTTGTPNK